jgi:hypothetical protein
MDGVVAVVGVGVDEAAVAFEEPLREGLARPAVRSKSV